MRRRRRRRRRRRCRRWCRREEMIFQDFPTDSVIAIPRKKRVT